MTQGECVRTEQAKGKGCSDYSQGRVSSSFLGIVWLGKIVWGVYKRADEFFFHKNSVSRSWSKLLCVHVYTAVNTISTSHVMAIDVPNAA